MSWSSSRASGAERGPLIQSRNWATLAGRRTAAGVRHLLAALVMQPAQGLIVRSCVSVFRGRAALWCGASCHTLGHDSSNCGFTRYRPVPGSAGSGTDERWCRAQSSDQRCGFSCSRVQMPRPRGLRKVHQLILMPQGFARCQPAFPKVWLCRTAQKSQAALPRWATCQVSQHLFGEVSTTAQWRRFAVVSGRHARAIVVCGADPA